MLQFYVTFLRNIAQRNNGYRAVGEWVERVIYQDRHPIVINDDITVVIFLGNHAGNSWEDLLRRRYAIHLPVKVITFKIKFIIATKEIGIKGSQ